MRPLLIAATLVIGLVLTLPPNCFAQLSDLAAMTPGNANVIIAIDAAAVQKTPLAEKQGWSRKLEAAYVDRAIFLPPEADKLIIASQVFPNHGFAQVWEAAIMTMTEPLSMRSIARAEGGYVDQINGKEAVWSPSDAYLIGVGEKTLGIISPAQRQAVSRWIGNLKSSRVRRLPAYLDMAIARVTPTNQIVMAIDLKDAASPHRVADTLESSEAITKANLNVEKVVSLIGSLVGASVEIAIDSQATAKIRIDFGQPVNMPDATAKQLVLEAAKHLGLDLPGLEKAKLVVVDKAIIMEGVLPTDGLRRVLSLLEIPTTKFSELREKTAGMTAATGNPNLPPKTTSPGDPQSQTETAKSSQVYYKSVMSLLDDLRQDRDKQDPRGGMDAVWMERYARKIDRLPILNVDPQLLDWGAKTAGTLRTMATTRRGAGLNEGVRNAQLRTSSNAYAANYYNYTYNYNGAGYGVVTNATGNEKDRNQIHKEEQNRATATKVEGWQLIEEASANIRRVMTERYGIEF